MEKRFELSFTDDNEIFINDWVYHKGKKTSLMEIENVLNIQEAEIQKLQKNNIKKAIIPDFEIGDYFIDYSGDDIKIWQYIGNLHFKCLNPNKGCKTNAFILGTLLLKEDFVKKITKEKAQKMLKILGEK